MAEAAPPQFLLQGDVYEVEKLVGIKIENGKKLYKIRWKGYSAQADTYEPEENLLSCKDMIVELEEDLEKKKAKRSIRNVVKQNGSIEEPWDAAQKIENVESCRDQSKDTFWKDFNAGKIDVFGQDMYSKVKERASRAVTNTDNKQGEATPPKEIPLLLCPKVVLKRRTNPKSSVPTYRSSLHLKPVSISVKKRKKYDVLRDYRRRKYRCSRKRNVDENKLLNIRSRSEILYPNILSRTITVVKSKKDLQTAEVPSLEYLKILKELSANDEIASNDGLEYTSIPLPTSTPPKILLESEAKMIQSTNSEEFNEILKDAFKTEISRRILTTGKECSNQLSEDQPAATVKNNPGSSTTLTLLNCVNSKMKSLCCSTKTENLPSHFSVVNTHQTTLWKAMILKESMENLLLFENDSHKMNRHMFDLLMATSIQGRLEITEKLCSRGVSLNHSLGDGTTLLMTASQMGLHDVVKILLRYNAHKDVQNNNGETALMLACRYKHSKVVKLLLEYGANFALTNIEGINASRISNKCAHNMGVSNIMNEHISRMKLEFEMQARNVIEGIAEIKYALFPLQCFSLGEGPFFSINFSHHVELESPGKGVKEFLLFVAKCRIKGNRIRCEFFGGSPIVSASLNGIKQEAFKDTNFLFRISCLQTGNNTVHLTTISEPKSEVKLVVCAYRVHYWRSYFAHSTEKGVTNPSY